MRKRPRSRSPGGINPEGAPAVLVVSIAVRRFGVGSLVDLTSGSPGKRAPPPARRRQGGPLSGLLHESQPCERLRLLRRCSFVREQASPGKSPARTLTSSNGTSTRLATLVAFDRQEQIPSPRCSFYQLPMARPRLNKLSSGGGVAIMKPIVSRRSHAERRGEFARVAPCHRSRKRERGFRKDHDRHAYRRRIDEKRPAARHHRSRQPAADADPLHREPPRLGPQVSRRSRVADPSRRCAG